jgi:hypothetical protein
LEEARSMGGTILVTASSTRPLLRPSPRSEHGARTQAFPYVHGRTLHSSGFCHSRWFLFYSSYIDIYIPYLCIIQTLWWNVAGLGRAIGGPAGGRSAEDGGFVGPARGDGAEAAAANDGGSPVHASSWAKDGCSSASFIIRYTATSTSRARYSCKYEYNCLSLYVHA